MTFDNRTTELIAIGASVAARCQSCLEHHLAKAAEYGIEQSEVLQALEIGRTVRKGAPGWSGGFPFCGCETNAKA
jgi:AhpD family alkylhydroperoxidase